MKNILFLLLAFTVGTASAQKFEKKVEKKENLEAEKVAFITTELSLTTEEAQKFWPVYNQLEAERKELRKQKRETLKEGKNMDELTDAELEKIMENMLVYKQKELDMDKKYHTKFKEVLSVKKLAKFYRAEEKWKRVLLNKIKNKKGGGDIHD